MKLLAILLLGGGVTLVLLHVELKGGLLILAALVAAILDMKGTR